MHAHVVDGNVETVSDLPPTWRLSDGSTVSGFPYLDPEIHAAEGWVPVTDVVPEHDASTQMLGDVSYGITFWGVTRTWEVIDRPADPPTLQQQIDALTAAVEELTLVALMEGL